MSKRASVFAVNKGLVVTVHAGGDVWTKHYESDIKGLPELGELGLFESADGDALGVDYPLSDDFDTERLVDAGFARKKASLQ